MRQDIALDELAAALDRLAAKGSIRKVDGKSGPAYSKLPLVLGMYEMQVNRLTAGLERDQRAYLDEAFGERALFATRTPQMRTVPVPQVHPGRARRGRLRRCPPLRPPSPAGKPSLASAAG